MKTTFLLVIIFTLFGLLRALIQSEQKSVAKTNDIIFKPHKNVKIQEFQIDNMRISSF